MPSSAIPIMTTSYNSLNASQANHYHSVPSSPMHHQQQNNTVFQFNPNMLAQKLKQTAQANSNFNSNNNNNTNSSNGSYSSNYHINQQHNHGFETYFNEGMHPKATKTTEFDAATVVLSEKIEAIDKRAADSKGLDSPKEADLLQITNKTYSENDVEMVQEILNDMIQKEENIKDSKGDELSNQGNLIGGPITMTNTVYHISPQNSYESSPKSNGDTILNYSMKPPVEAPYESSPCTMLVDKINESDLDADFLDNNDSKLKSSTHFDGVEAKAMKLVHNSLESLTAAANILLTSQKSHDMNNPNDGGYQDEEFNSSYLSNVEGNRSIFQKNSAFTLSNLSAAASAEYLQFNNKNDSREQIDNLNMNPSGFKKKKLHHSGDSKADEAKKFKNEFYLVDSCYQQDNYKKQLKPVDTKLNLAEDINLKFNVLDQKASKLFKKANNLADASEKSLDLSIRSHKEDMSKLNSSMDVIQNCSECGKTFTNKSALAKHQVIHSNLRKYSCHLCDKSFKRQDHLNGHLLTHQDKKPFVCKAPDCDKSYCDSRFTTNPNRLLIIY